MILFHYFIANFKLYESVTALRNLLIIAPLMVLICVGYFYQKSVDNDTAYIDIIHSLI